MSPRRIAVLGAGGFLGSHLVPALVARFDCPIDAVDIDLRKLDTQPSAGVRPRRSHRTAWPDFTRSPSGATWSSRSPRCAIQHSTRPPRVEVIDANYTHLVPLVECCEARGVRLIHFSTAEVYGRMALDSSGEPNA